MSDYNCKDCKHSFIEKKDWILYPFFFFGAFDVIEHSLKCRKAFVEQEVEKNPVIGDKVKPAHYLSCGLARSEYRNEHCGKNAKYWQPRDPKKLFLWIKKENV